MFTSGSPDQVADRLTRLVEPYAEIDARRDTWMPRGFLAQEESTLEESQQLLASDHCQELINWWLARPRGATKPNWDIAATAMVGGQKGIVLVEAKAHHAELSDAGKSPGGQPEQRRSHPGSDMPGQRGTRGSAGRMEPDYRLTLSTVQSVCVELEDRLVRSAGDPGVFGVSKYRGDV